MMKRVIAAAFALVLLCGCSARKEEPYSLSLADDLLATAAFEGSEMAPLDTAIVTRLYGIDETTVTDCVSYMATNTSVSADELTILILTDEKAAIAAEEACRARLDSQIAVCRDYAPAAVPRLEGAVVSRRGNTVLLAAGDPAILSTTEGIG